MGRAFIATALTSLLTLAGSTLWSASASAEFRVDGPFTYDNLSVYRVHDGAAQASAPLDVGTAVKQGLVKFHSSINSGVSVTADNLSDRAVFVQFGTLLVGATQDQVVGTEYILPPRSIGTPIHIFCVEKGRWEPRAGEDAASYSTTGALLPSGMAHLAMLAGSDHSSVADRLRQIGVWMNVDDIQRNLSDVTGIPIEQSTTSLPATLKNPALESAERPYLAALRTKYQEDPDIFGVVFAVNGKLQSADIYSSGDLFRQMWPQLLRTAAIEAIAAKGNALQTPPESGRVRAFLSESTIGPISDSLFERDRGIEKHYGEHAAYYEVRSSGHWFHRRYLTRGNLLAPALTLQQTVLTLLETGAVGKKWGIPITDQEGDQAFQVGLLSNIVSDSQHSILRSANIESHVSERARVLLEPVLDRTFAALSSVSVTSQPASVSSYSNDESGILNWLILPGSLLAFYAMVAVWSVVRGPARRSLPSPRDVPLASDCPAWRAVTPARGQPQSIPEAVGEMGDHDFVSGHGEAILSGQEEENSYPDCEDDAWLDASLLRRRDGDDPCRSVTQENVLQLPNAPRLVPARTREEQNEVAEAA